MLALTVHRATDQIGGNCIEIAAGGGRIILDVGLPLDAPDDAGGLLPTTLDLGASADGVLISHPHQDHYGLLREAPANWPVFCGSATAKLVRLTSEIFGEPIARDFRTWSSGHPLAIGPFTVTPFLTDHSAFDAYMLLIDFDGKRILYTGDFRTHGRKGALVKAFMAKPRSGVDVLIMEGTNLGSRKPWMSESDLEDRFAELFRTKPGRVFVAWSAQNIDRTVTLYRACRKAGRILAIDLYAADVLDTLREHGQLPQPGWPNIKVVVTRALANMFRRKGREAFIERMMPHGIAARKLAENRDRWVIMTRRSLLKDFEAAGVVANADDAWSWSMWDGYLAADDGQRVKSWFESGGARAAHIHTSGHASPEDLQAFAEAIGARQIVPVHGIAWDANAERFAGIRRLRDGEVLTI